MHRGKEGDRNSFPGWTQFLQGHCLRVTVLEAVLPLAASSKQTSEQSGCPDVLYKHRGEIIRRKIQSWGVLTITCLGLCKTGHGCCTFSFSVVACMGVGVWVLQRGRMQIGTHLAQKPSQDTLTDADVQVRFILGGL